jgi:hypothetical protein
MKLRAIAVLWASFLPVYALNAQKPVSASIAPEGVSRLDRIDGRHHLNVQFTTHKATAPAQTADHPFDWASQCTGSISPCVVIDNIRIRYDEKNIFLSRSAYADCSDIGVVSVQLHKGIYSLIVSGGTGDEGYIATIRFTSHRVLDRTLVSGEDSTHVFERTTYYVVPALN